MNGTSKGRFSKKKYRKPGLMADWLPVRVFFWQADGKRSRPAESHRVRQKSRGHGPPKPVCWACSCFVYLKCFISRSITFGVLPGHDAKRRAGTLHRHSGQKYSELKGVIGVLIIDYEMYPEDSLLHHCFRFVDRKAEAGEPVEIIAAYTDLSVESICRLSA